MKTKQSAELNIEPIPTPNRRKCHYCPEPSPNFQIVIGFKKVTFHMACHPVYVDQALKDSKRTLTLHLKNEYFNQIKAGTKREEYRLFKDYWKKRIHHNDFEFILLLCGYPKANDHAKRLVCHYTGHEVKDIIHPEFGENPVRVFALFVDRKV